MGPIDAASDLLIDLEGDGIAIVALLADLPAEKDELVLLAERQWAERAHPELGDHPSRDRRRPLDVVRGPRGELFKDEVLGHLASHKDRDVVLELCLRLEDAVLVRHGPRIAASHTASDDGDLPHR